MLVLVSLHSQSCVDLPNQNEKPYMIKRVCFCVNMKVLLISLGIRGHHGCRWKRLMVSQDTDHFPTPFEYDFQETIQEYKDREIES